MMPQEPPKQRFVPHKTLHEGWTYVSIEGDGIVVGVRIAITKVMKLLDQNNNPIKAADGTPAYSLQSTNIVRVLTEAEYNVIRKTSLSE